MGLMVGLQDAFVSAVRPLKEGGANLTDEKCSLWSARITVGDAYPPTVRLPPLRTGQLPPSSRATGRGTVVLVPATPDRPAPTRKASPMNASPMDTVTDQPRRTTTRRVAAVVPMPRRHLDANESPDKVPQKEWTIWAQHARRTQAAERRASSRRPDATRAA